MQRLWEEPRAPQDRRRLQGKYRKPAELHRNNLPMCLSAPGRPQ